MAFRMSGDTVIVREVLSDSQAHERGLKAGDVVNRINTYPVTSISDAMSYISYATSGDGILHMIITSNGEEHKIKLESKPHEQD